MMKKRGTIDTMKKILDLITEEMEQAFADAGYEKELARVTLSNRPDLCEYQCNGAMAGAKKYHKAPIMIAEEVVAKIPENGYISGAEAVKPGFINLKTNPAAVADYLNQMEADEKLGVEEVENPKTIVIDYGGPNVAKPLHVGHLRSAIIGESVKRITRFMGNKVVGDIHLGDWGYQMGLIITELKKRQPDLPYFDDNFTGEYPKEAPFTISDLEEIYPAASAYAKEHDDYREEALDATFQLQSGKRGYRAIWDHIMNVSVTDLKKNYANLNVEFDLWKGESDAQKYIPDMVERLKKEGHAHIDNGALVVDVKEETDTKEIPPCMILKSDGAALYDTTDLATLVEREELFQPNEVIYVVDKRQELHFVQVFRCAKKTGIVKEDTKLTFLGFDTNDGVQDVRTCISFKRSESVYIEYIVFCCLVGEVSVFDRSHSDHLRCCFCLFFRYCTVLCDLFIHLFCDLADQVLKTHNAAFSGLERFPVFSVHRTKSKERVWTISRSFRLQVRAKRL